MPEPVIKSSKRIGNNLYHYLSWSGEKGGKWRGEDFFTVVTEDGEIMKTIQKESFCGTRKSRDKRVKDSTFGLIVGAFPCGTVVVWEELYNSEGIMQVHAILGDYFSNVSDKNDLKFIIYDDACHLCRYSNKYRVLRSYDSDHLNQRVPGGTDTIKGWPL